MTHNPELVIVSVLVFLGAIVATGAIRRFALRTGLLDHPTHRSSHVHPTPRSGGGAIVLLFLASLLLVAAHGLLEVAPVVALTVAGAAVALVGFIDDRKSLPARTRFCVHVAAALIAVSLIGTQRINFLPSGLPARDIIFAALAVLAVVWSTNLFNFMDGIDGIAGAQGAFVSGAGAAIVCVQFGTTGLAVAFACLASATLGFLAWNWPPAKIFMGDVGSGFLGFMLAGLALLASERSGVPLAVWVILNGSFLVDASVTLLRRILRGERWLEPHRLHAYQHLARRWKAHLPVTLLFLAINLGWLLPWAWCAAKFPARASVCLSAALVPLIAAALMAGGGRLESANQPAGTKQRK